MFLKGKTLSIRDPNHRDIRSIFGVDGDYSESDIINVDYDGDSDPAVIIVESKVTYYAVSYEVEETDEVDVFGNKILIRHIKIGDVLE